MLIVWDSVGDAKNRDHYRPENVFKINIVSQLWQNIFVVVVVVVVENMSLQLV